VIKTFSLISLRVLGFKHHNTYYNSTLLVPCFKTGCGTHFAGWDTSITPAFICAPRFHSTQFHILLTPFSWFFSNFLHSTCSLSVYFTIFRFNRHIPAHSDCNPKQSYSWRSSNEVWRCVNWVITIYDTVFQQILHHPFMPHIHKLQFHCWILNLIFYLFIRHY